ncbi:DNA mismatch repair protein MSH2 [Enteropsectra breve]|nr:DNA mismatch repair protein MSH2 [Enteropsectra breve]
MDAKLKEFQRKQDPTVFKYFIVDEHAYVCGTDIKMLPKEMQPKTGDYTKVDSIDYVVKDLLMNQKICVEEYNGTVLTRSGHPSSYGGFLDICISDSIPPTICAVRMLSAAESSGLVREGAKNPKFCNFVEFCFILDSKLRVDTFLDDDLFSCVFSLVNIYNCTEILYDSPLFERIVNGWGVNGQCCVKKGQSCADAINRFLKKQLPVEKFTRKDCCFVDIKDFDLVPFKCATSQGKRLLDQWLRSPLISIPEIQKRLDLSEAFTKINIDLRACPDLKRLVAKILNKKIKVQEIVRLYQTVQQIPKIAAHFKYHVKTGINDLDRIKDLDRINESDNIKELNEIFVNEFIQPLEYIYNLVQPVLNEIEMKIDMENARIKTNMSAALELIDSKKKAVEKEMKAEYERIRREYPKAKMAGNFFRISKTEYDEEKFNKNSYVVVSILKSGVNFITKRLRDATSEIAVIKERADNEEENILAEIRRNLGTHVNSIEIYNYVISLIDIFKTFSEFVSLPNYCRPEFSSSEYLLVDLFHPILESRGYISNTISFKSNITNINNENMESINNETVENYNMDICNTENINNEIINDNKENEINSSNRNKIHGSVVNNQNGEERSAAASPLCILTGPNMGGKSTFMKAVSIISLYAQIGCYVPAKKAKIPLFDGIFLRVGAKDFSSRGLSTFMVEMVELNRVLRGASKNSLVLVDELGRGTSAIDGLALVTALKEYLLELGCYSIMATHFSELSDESSYNIHMGVDDGVLLYKIKEGAASSSFGIQTAVKARFPDAVIKDALKYLEKSK